MTRIPAVDAVRGLALVHMVVYHFFAFSSLGGLLSVDLASPALVVWQRSIASTFFLLVGVGLALGTQRGVDWRRLGWRQAKLAVFAGVVTVTSLVLDPSMVVVFGILHAIFVCTWLALPLAQRPRLAAGLGALLVLAATLSDPFFDGRAWAWTGLAAHPPLTFDRQPLLPYLGVVLLGVPLGHAWRARPSLAGDAQHLLTRGLGLLGRWSMWIYMAHVPVLIGIVGLLLHLR